MKVDFSLLLVVTFIVIYAWVVLNDNYEIFPRLVRLVADISARWRAEQKMADARFQTEDLRQRIVGAWKARSAATDFINMPLARRIALFAYSAMEILDEREPNFAAIDEDTKLKFIVSAIASSRLHTQAEMDAAITTLEFMSLNAPPAADIQHAASGAGR